MIARGVGADVELLNNQIRIIRHKGLGHLLHHGLRGDKDIAISAITSVQFKPAGLLTRGYIQFAFAGAQESKGGVVQAARDENSVVFVKNRQDEFIDIKNERDKRRGGLQETVNAAEEITRFADLRDKGIITAAEFEAKKQQLLGL